ncbi:hypothetical protein [Hymenobacter cellulosilyticus]|uniref:Uncharacterized protein n=1 Tax=Hymenobacter cellulosilyticus TaxID=2932248 RepID=A0A8T9QA57_9BACT|nr:hypothetical protein [Hymenobacter cellulosilyticus]UOQ74456.1 hypothetical protein MUN79_11590 [Hymenobacter cellulosilyticus]
MTILTLADQPIPLESIWHHYVDQRPSPMQYSLVIDKQETLQLACVVRYADCGLDSALLEARIRSKDARQRSMGLLWLLQEEWKTAGLIQKGNKTPIIYTLHNITHVGWDYERLTIRGGAAM